MAAERQAVLHLGPDVRGGMTEVMRGLLGSPLSECYAQEMVATHRGSGPLRRLAVYLAALVHLFWWSVRGRGRIVHIHATVRGSMYRKAICVLAARLLRRRVVLQVHSGPGDIVTFRAGLGPARIAFIRFALRSADVVLAVSSASAAALEEAFLVDGIAVIPNAAPPLAPPSERRKDAGEVTLAAYLGGFANPVKGGSVLLAALRRASDSGLRVALAGPGELPSTGRELVEQGRAEWRGWLDTAERNRLLREADIFVLPSTSEGLPMALLEALSAGAAVVATEVGGVPDVVAPGVEALVIPPDDPDALAGALARVAGDPQLRKRLGQAARERARSLGADRVAARLDAIYRELL